MYWDYFQGTFSPSLKDGSPLLYLLQGWPRLTHLLQGISLVWVLEGWKVLGHWRTREQRHGDLGVFSVRDRTSVDKPYGHRKFSEFTAGLLHSEYHHHYDPDCQHYHQHWLHSFHSTLSREQMEFKFISELNISPKVPFRKTISETLWSNTSNPVSWLILSSMWRSP